jgi:hypothetical protein
MGEIISFPSNKGRLRRAAAPSTAGEAKILFFMGVRYVKFDDSAIARSEPALKSRNATTRNRKRKRRA